MTETEKLFAHADLSGQSPPGICHKCAESALEHVPTGSVFCYCPHSETGTMRRPRGQWIIAEQISAAAFRAAILGALLESEQLIIDSHGGCDEIRH